MLLVAVIASLGWSSPPLRTSSCLPRASNQALSRASRIYLNVAGDKYGSDPREGLSESEIKADVAWAAASIDMSAGRVGELGSVGQLQAAIDTAADDCIVVLKFEREGCAACAATRDLYADTAAAFGERGLFFVVDYDKSTAFCRQVKVRVVPCGHIFCDGKLHAALPLGKKSWQAFREELDAVVAG